MAIATMTRAEALSQGLKVYRSVKPCRKCGSDIRRVGGHCVECDQAASRQWAKTNPERHLEKTKRWIEKNPVAWAGIAMSANKAWRRRQTERGRKPDPVRNREKVRKYYYANKAKVNAKKLLGNGNRRARLRGAGGTHTATDLAEIFAAQGGRCAYCRADLKRKNKHVDHIVPLAKGGSNGRQNLQYLCAPCNQTKSARDPIDFAQSLGLLL